MNLQTSSAGKTSVFNEKTSVCFELNNETLAFEQAVVYLRFKQAVIWFSFVLEQKRKISFLQKIQTGHLEYIICTQFINSASNLIL